MTASELDRLVASTAQRYAEAAALVAASLRRYKTYDPSRDYTPEEREPWDALCDRYLRTVEMAIRLFRTIERARLAVNSESYRDLLANMAKWRLIADDDLWFRMRDLRNRIAHDYLPEQLAEIYSAIDVSYGPELLALADRLGDFSLNPPKDSTAKK